MCVLAESVIEGCALGHVVCSVGEAFLAESTYRQLLNGATPHLAPLCLSLSLSIKEASFGANYIA